MNYELGDVVRVTNPINFEHIRGSVATVVGVITITTYQGRTWVELEIKAPSWAGSERVLAQEVTRINATDPT